MFPSEPRSIGQTLTQYLLSFKNKIQIGMLFIAAHFKTVIPRGDQHEAGTAKSERRTHRMSPGGTGESAASRS